MQTIELVGKKSVVKFDVSKIPDADVLGFQGVLYTPKDANRLIWEESTGAASESSRVLILDGWIETIEPAPIDQSPTPTEPPVDAQPDHAETV